MNTIHTPDGPTDAAVVTLCSDALNLLDRCQGLITRTDDASLQDAISALKTIVHSNLPVPEKYQVFAVFGSEDTPLAENGQWKKLGNDPTVYEFGTEAEQTAFIDGCEAAEGWLDWHQLSDKEYAACCKKRGIAL